MHFLRDEWVHAIVVSRLLLLTFDTTCSLTHLPYHISTEYMYFRVACPETLSQVSQTRHESRPGTFTAKELFGACQARTNTSL